MDSPITFFVKRVLVPIAIVAGILAGLSLLVKAGSCNHDRNTVEFWNEARLLPAVVTHIDGNEVVVKTSDKREVQVHTLVMYEKTERNGKLEKDKPYMFVYCAKCYAMHGYKPISP